MPKASSVRTDGSPDGFVNPRSLRAQISPDGTTRLVVYVPPDELRERHLLLLRALGTPLSLRYVQLTDRATGALPRPLTFVRMDIPADEVLAALDAAADLVWHDGRHQLWVRGRFGEQVVLDELGVLYCYPDDPTFRDALADLSTSPAVGMDGRDYVKVEFLAHADALETAFIERLGLVRWG